METLRPLWSLVLLGDGTTTRSLTPATASDL